MRLALSVGRFDFWNMVSGKRSDEMTPYEELVWRAFEIVEPWGERRADIRSAVNTLCLGQMQRTKPFTADQISSVIDRLTQYLKPTEEMERLTPDEAAKRGKAAFAAIGK